MRFKRLDLNLLVALDALLTEGSVSRAADKMNLSQSAMSAALRRMRDYFGDELFVTIGRQTKPTALALELAEPVRRILNEINADIISREPFDPLTSRRSIAVAASDYVMRVVLAKFLTHLKQAAPHMRVDIWPLTGSTTLTSFANGEIDMLISVGPILNPDLPTGELYTEKFVGIAWSDNDEIGDVVTLDDFVRLGHVAVRLGSYRATAIDENFLVQAGIERRIEVTTGAFDQIPELVVGTPRIAMLQRRLALHYTQTLPIRMFELPFEVPPIRVGMQWHRHNASDSAHNWFREQLTDWVNAQP